MAIQVVELPLQTQPQWGQDLAAVLQDAGQGYQQSQRQRELRAEQLADVASARGYQAGRDTAEHEFQKTQFDHEEAARVAFYKMEQEGQLWPKLTTALYNEHLLDAKYIGTDPNDPSASPEAKAAVQVALAISKHNGLLVEMHDAIAHGNLNPRAIDNPEAVAQARIMEAADSANQYKQAQRQRDAAGSAASSVSKQLTEVQAQMQGVQDYVAQAEQAAASPLDPDKVMARATELAMATAKKAGFPSKEEIAAQGEAAAREIQARNDMNAQNAAKRAQAILGPLQRMATTLTTRQTQMEKMGVFGDTTADTNQTGDTNPAPSTLATGIEQIRAAARAAARAAFAGAGAAAPPGDTTPRPAPGWPQRPGPTAEAAAPQLNALTDAGADPQAAQMIAQENAQRTASLKGAQLSQIEGPINVLTSQLNDIQRQIQSVKAGALSAPVGTYGVPGMSPTGPTAPDVSRQATALSQLYAQATAIQTKLQQLQKQKQVLTGPQTTGQTATLAPNATPNFSDASGSAPPPPAPAMGISWWGGGNPAVSGP